MRPADRELAYFLDQKLRQFDQNVRPLLGIHNEYSKACLIEQMVDSIRRIKYVITIKNKELSETCCQSDSIAFDPFKAAILHHRRSNIDEAFWLIFLGTHFGKHKNKKWELVKGVYGELNSGNAWTWDRVQNHLNEFRRWLSRNQPELKELGSFGNHRKYQSLGAFNEKGTGSTIASYTDWVGEAGHLAMIENRFSFEERNDPQRLFHSLYKSMSSIMGFGRTAKFDFLTMVGKIGLLNIIPDLTYMNQATGPLRGARLLFGGDVNSQLSHRNLELYLTELDNYLGLYFGKQVLEDSICNWQKSPANYQYFGG